MKIMLAIAALLFAATLMMGCSGEPQHELVGRWVREDHGMDGPVVRGRVTVTIYDARADGTGYITERTTYYRAPDMERVENENVTAFSWSADGGYLTLRNYMPGHAMSYEIRTDSQGAETLYMELTLFERLSGEPGGLYGEWGVTADGRFEGFAFFEDGTGSYIMRWEGFELDDGRPIPPTESIMGFVWSAEGGYVTISFYSDGVFPYLIDGDALNLGYWEMTRIED